MEQIKERLEQLTHQKGTITPDYLKTTSLADLKGKIKEIENFTKGIHEIWDSIN